MAAATVEAKTQETMLPEGRVELSIEHMFRDASR